MSDTTATTPGATATAAATTPTAHPRPAPRQIPRFSQLAPLLRLQSPALSPTARRARRLQRAADIRDIRLLARRATPRAPFDYVDGAANGEEGLRRNLAVFRGVELRPSVLRDVAEVDLSLDVFGRRSELPVGLAPTGFNRLMHTDGEYAVATAAREYGVPLALSTMGSVSIEDLAAAEPALRRWFQLYLWTQRRDDVASLLERAGGHGYDVLLVTVDTATGGLRYRDARNGMSIPPRLTARTFFDASYRLRWWTDLVTTPPLRFETLDADASSPTVVRSMFDPSLSYDDLAWIRSAWSGTLLVKGIMTPDDARRALDHGVDGIYVSNHGGRQLDRPPVPLRELPGIRAAVGPDVPIVLDSGITSGGDILAALALGADFTMIGRAYLYGLMAGGLDGVRRVLDILRTEMTVTLQLMGARSIDELDPDRVRLDRG